MALGTIATGTRSSLRLDSVDAGRVAEATVKKATQKAEATNPTKDQIKYTAVGESVFNCMSRTGRKINFSGGCYMCNKTKATDSEIIEALEYFVETGRLTKEEGSAT